jgi:hypothetical protein
VLGGITDGSCTIEESEDGCIDMAQRAVGERAGGTDAECVLRLNEAYAAHNAMQAESAVTWAEKAIEACLHQACDTAVSGESE